MEIYYFCVRNEGSEITCLHLLIFVLKKPGGTNKRQCSIGAGGERVDKVIVTCDNSQCVNFYFVLIFEQCKCITCLKFNLIKIKPYTAKSV